MTKRIFILKFSFPEGDHKTLLKEREGIALRGPFLEGSLQACCGTCGKTFRVGFLGEMIFWEDGGTHPEPNSIELIEKTIEGEAERD